MKFFSKLFRPKKTIIHTYKHLIWVESIKLTAHDYDIILPALPTISKILKNKLMVVVAMAMNTDKLYFEQCQGKVEVLKDLIGYLDDLPKKLEQEAHPTPIGRDHF